MAPVDLKDAFYYVPLAAHHRTYLRFFANAYLKFAFMSNGFGPAMRIFTKITKVGFSVFWMQGKTAVLYVADSYLLGGS